MNWTQTLELSRIRQGELIEESQLRRRSRATRTAEDQERAKARLKAAWAYVQRRGRSWDCSEPTVKRQLGSEELSLTRLLTLLDWLSLSLAELHKMAESGSTDEARYTAKQNEYLAKNPKAFAFLMKMFEVSPKEIGEKYGLSPQERDRILIQLEKYDLIRPGVRGQMRPAYQRPPMLDGRLGAVHTRDFIDRFGSYFKN